MPARYWSNVIFRKFTFAVLASVLFIPFALIATGAAHAGELRVLDHSGLTRAARSVSGNGQVIVRVSPNVPAKDVRLILAPVDVIGREIEGAVQLNEVRFSAVKEGTWQLKGTPQFSEILSVSIQSGAP